MFFFSRSAEKASEMKTHQRRRITGFLLLLLLIGVAAGGRLAYSFDTGHHRDLTAEVLRDFGFSDSASKVVIVSNWLVDYYSNSPTGEITQIKADLEKLHFDNLFSTKQVQNYWDNLTVNTRIAVQKAAQENDPLKCLTLLGISLHAVQDFASHSNWVETHLPTDARYRTETWFDRSRTDPSDVHTGHYPDAFTPAGAKEPHGGYTTGLNKDSYVRPRWDQAYVFAYVSSRRWVAAVKAWVTQVDPGFWQRVQAFQATGQNKADLDFDVLAAYRISEWVQSFEANGHWKGNGSGDISGFTLFAADWVAAHDSAYVQQFKVKRVHRLLTPNLFSDNTTIPPAGVTVPTVPNVPKDRRAVIVRTLAVSRVPSFFDLVPANFYAQVVVDGFPFLETMVLHNNSILPAWTTIRFVPTSKSTLAIRYDLRNEGGLVSSDFSYDINPKASKTVLDFNYAVGTRVLTGDVTGRHDATSNAVVVTGSGSGRATIRFFVTEKALR